MGFNATIFAGNYLGAYRQTQLLAERRAEAAALIATQRTARKGLAKLRDAMRSAGLGTLGQAMTSSSDAETTGRVFRRTGGWSASGMIHLRKKVSERSIGAIEAYTQGARIRPTGENGPWLWIATDQIPKRAGKFRMTPRRFKAAGLESRLGPLVMVKRPNGHPLLVVNNVTVRSAAGGRARRVPQNGRIAAGRTQVSIVAFIGIPFTARTRRINLFALTRQMRAELPGEFVRAFKDTV